MSDARQDRARLEQLQGELRALRERLARAAAPELEAREAALKEQLAPLRSAVRLQELALAPLTARVAAATQSLAALEVARTAHATQREVPLVTVVMLIGATVALVRTHAWWFDSPGLLQALGLGGLAAGLVLVWQRRLSAAPRRP